MSQRCFNYSDRTYQVKSEYTRTLKPDYPAADLIEANVFTVTNLKSKQEKRGAATMVYSVKYKDVSSAFGRPMPTPENKTIYCVSASPTMAAIMTTVTPRTTQGQSQWQSTHLVL